MNEIEALCDRILMIDNGRTMLYGDLADIKASYRSSSVIVDFEGEVGELPGVIEKRTHKGHVELVLDGSTTPQRILEQLIGSGVAINRFEVATPSLNEIFLQVVDKNHE